MRWKCVKPEDLVVTSDGVTRVTRANTGAGRYCFLFRTPEWATAQMEHSWLEILELAAWTWTTSTTPTNAMRKMQSSESVRENAALPAVCRIEITSHSR